eukprot:TRINITY_DN776_c0_g1_i2.p1 TRINITY_DN776_c0_g1~~TRINITY_DN776_c0_g1_i2.p1  ORF type:complete len:719 (+),score=181.89 TRINITY_DN776_c0_g1_i2:1013-3169(+)
MKQYSQLVPLVISKLLPFGAKYTQAVQTDDWEVSSKLCRIFSDLGEAYMPFVEQGSAEAMSICNTLFECAAHPDPEVNTMTFNFWASLAQALLTSTDKEQKIPPFTPYFLKLQAVLLTHMMLPDKFETWKEDHQEEIKNYRRYNLADTFRAATSIVGIEVTLTSLYDNLSRAAANYQQSNDWRPLECTLYAVRSVARAVDCTLDLPVLPKILDVVMAVPHVNLVEYTAVLIAGRYADWLRTHPTLLPQLLNFAISKLENAEVASAAALSFRNLCDGCSATMRQYQEPLFQVYDRSNKLNLDFLDHAEIITGLSIVISGLPAESLQPALERMCLPLVEQIHHWATAAPQQQQAEQQKERRFAAQPPPPPPPQGPEACAALGTALKKLSIIFRRVAADEIKASCYAVFEKIWPMLDQVIQQYIGSELVLKKACCAVREAVITCGAAALPLLVPLLQRCCWAVAAGQHHAPLRVVSSLVRAFHGERNTASVFLGALSELAKTATGLVRRSEDFALHPALVRHFFVLCQRCVFEFPTLFLKSGPALIVPLLRWSLLGLSIQEREASKALLGFHTDVFRAVKETGMQDDLERTLRSADAVDPTTGMVAVPLGVMLVQGWLLCVAGWQPYGCIPLVRDALSSALAAAPSLALELSASALAGFSLLPNEADAPAKTVLLQALRAPDAMANAGRGPLLRALEDFCRACRHSGSSTPESSAGSPSPQ